VAAGEEEQNKEERKGFAGLSSLVSDVDTSPPPPAKHGAETSDAVSNAELRTGPASSQPAPQPTQPKQLPYQARSQPTPESPTGKWALGIAAVIGVLWLIGEADKSPSALAPSYSTPARSTTPSYSAPPAQPQVPTRPDETKPPVGQDLVFSASQIRYCLAEEIRMDAAKAVLNNYSDFDVDRFNAMVTDYNSRCGSFRHRRGALKRAREEISPYRNQLYADGQHRFAHSNIQPGASGLGKPQTAKIPAERLSPSPAANTVKSYAEGVRNHADFSMYKSKCVYKSVMSNDDYRACGIEPPR